MRFSEGSLREVEGFCFNRCTRKELCFASSRVLLSQSYTGGKAQHCLPVDYAKKCCTVVVWSETKTKQHRHALPVKKRVCCMLVRQETLDLKGFNL